MKEEEWIPETVLKITNGKTIMEYYLILKSHKEIEGARITLQPFEVRRVTLRELLPKGYDDTYKLQGCEISLMTFNTSKTEDSKYSMDVEGPFRQPKTEADIAAQKEMDNIMKLHQSALDKRDFHAMKELIKEPVPEQYKYRTDFFASLSFGRGKMFSHLSRIEEADASFEDGWNGFKDAHRYFFAIIWANALMENLLVSKIENDKQNSIEKALRILDLATEWIKGVKYEKYYLMCADGMRAYCLCYLNRHEEAAKMFENFDFNPLSYGDFIAPNMYTFFEHIAYCFAAAIELKDGELIKNLCKILSTNKPGILQEDGAWRRMKMTFGSVRQQDRRTIKYSFDNFLDRSTNFYPQFPNLKAFLKLMAKNDEGGMEQFFK